MGSVLLFAAGFAIGWGSWMLADIFWKEWQRRKNAAVIREMEEEAKKREASRQRRSDAQKAAAQKKRGIVGAQEFRPAPSESEYLASLKSQQEQS